MLSHRDLMQLAESFQDRRVLTVYLHATVENPADRHRWQAELDQALRTLRERDANASHEERSALDGAIDNLREWLIAQRAILKSPGFVAVVNEDEVLFSTTMQTVVPNVATWRVGMHVAPLLREISLGMEAAVLLVDSRNAQLYRFAPPRNLEHLESMAASADIDVEHHLGAASTSFHSGTRGGTASERVERQLLTARDRLYAEAMVHAIEIADKDGWLVVAGNKRAIAAAESAVPAALQQRVITVDGVDMHSSLPEIARAVADAVRSHELALDTELVRGIIDEHGSRGRAVAGVRATRAMLDREGVVDLILSERFVDLYPTDTDDLVRHAFNQGAHVREVHGMAADEIDERAEGVVARLRYPMAAPA